MFHPWTQKFRSPPLRTQCCHWFSVCQTVKAPFTSVQRCFTSTETVRTIRDGEPRTATSTSTQLRGQLTGTFSGFCILTVSGFISFLTQSRKKTASSQSMCIHMRVDKTLFRYQTVWREPIQYFSQDIIQIPNCVAGTYTVLQSISIHGFTTFHPEACDREDPTF